ncbi:MAG: AsmA family protein, partial [Candidatus Hydrogenedentota bacterium]
MRWWKLVLIVFGALLALCVVIFGIFVATLDDDDYKRLVTSAVERWTGYKVDIRGDFSFRLSAQPSLAASDILFLQRPGGAKPPVQHIGRLNVQLAARPLVTGTILVKHLQIRDMTIVWVVGEDAGKQTRRPSAADKKPATIPIFEDVDLQNIRASISNRDGSRTDEVLLKQFDISKVAESGQLRVTGEGAVNDNAFFVEGQLGSLAEALDDTRPYPVKLWVGVADFLFNMSGTIDDVIHGNGLNVRVTTEEAELATLLNILKADSPPVGGLNLHALVTGDIVAPRVSDLAIRLGDETAPRFTAQGSIANARTSEGIDIQVAASIKSKAIIQWLLAQEFFDFNAMRLEGRLRETGGEIFLEEAVMEVSDEHGLSLRSEGTLGFGDPFQSPWVDETDVTTFFSSPTTQPFKPLLGAWLLDLGPVTGKARVIGSSERLSVEEMVVTIDEPGRPSIEVRGRVGAIEFETDPPVSGFEVLASIRTDTTSALSPIVGRSLPELGPLTANGRVYDHDGTFGLDNLDIRVGTDEHLRLTATGKVDRIVAGDNVSLEGINLLVSFRSPNTEAVSQLIGQQLPEVGTIDGTFLLSGTDTELSIKEARLLAESADRLRLSVTGAIGSVRPVADRPIEGIEFAFTAAAPDCSPFEKMCGIDLPDLGPVELAARVNDVDDNVDIRGIQLRCGALENPTLSARGDIRGVGSEDNISLNAAFETRSRLWIELVRRPVPEDIQVAGRVQLSGSLSNCRIDTFEISTKGEEQLSLGADGKAEKNGGSYNIDVHVVAKASTTTAINSIAGTSLPSLGPV